MTHAHAPQTARANDGNRRTPVLLVVAALVIRIGVLFVVGDTFVADPDNYRLVAINVAEHGCFGYGDHAIASRPVLYPLLVAGCWLMDPALWYSLAVLHVILGTATVLLTYRLGLRWGLGRWAVLAALLVAIDPILLLHSTLVMTETLATLLAVAGLLAVTSTAEKPAIAKAALAAALMALAVLCRPTFLVWMASVLVLLPLVVGGSWRVRVSLFATSAIAATVVLAPWAIRNGIRFGKPTPATNHGGYTLLLANNPSFYEYLRTNRSGEVWDAEQFNRDWSIRSREVAGKDEVAIDRLAYADALAVIRSQPDTFIYSCFVRVGRLWGLVPHRAGQNASSLRRTARWAVGLFYGVESLLALIGIGSLLAGRLPREVVLRGWIWGLILVASFTAIHTFYWTNIRMRAPLIPVVCLAAALGAARILVGGMVAGRGQKSSG